MKFHHIVEINDPLYPLADTLSREQLWNGLMLRARDPVPFVLDLDRCVITRKGPDSIARRLYFGSAVIEDEVFFEPPARMRTVTRPQPGMPSATLVMTIEEPDAEHLSLRFDYDTGDSSEAGGAGIDEFYDSYRKSAYVEADIDAVGRIRQLAAEGKL